MVLDKLLFALAYLMWALGLPEAVLWAASLRPTNGDFLALRRLRRQALLAVGRDGDAAVEFYQCIRIKAQDPRALFHLTRALFRLRKFEAAESTARLAIEADPRPKIRAAIVAMRAAASAGAASSSGAARTPAAALAMAPAALLRLSTRQRTRLVKRIRRVVGRTRLLRSASNAVSHEDAVTGRPSDYIDLFYSGAVLIQAMIVNKIVRLERARPGGSLILVLKSLGMILGHIYLWWAISRPFPSPLTAFTFTLPAFAVYVAFIGGFNKTVPHEIAMSQFQGRRIGFSAAIISDMSWEIICVAVGTALSYIYCIYVTPGTFSIGPIKIDVPVFLSYLFLAYVLGLSVSVIVQQVVDLAPSLHTVVHLVGLVLFLTSGVYQGYASEPLVVQQVLWYNPIASVVEFSRKSFSPGYSTADLSLSYSVIFACTGAIILMLRGNFTKPARAHA